MSNFKTVGCTKYVYENCSFTQYSDRNGVKYVRCDQCLATGVIRDENFRLIRPHTCHVNEDLQFGTVDSHADDDTVGDDYSNNIDCVTSLMRKSDHKAHDLMWKHPFTSVVSGPTSCGKTVFIFKLIENMKEMLTPAPTKTVYCYGEYQPLFDNYPRVEFHEGLPDITMFDGVPTLLILDDLMGEDNDAVTKLFTKVSHHRNVSVIYLTQNIFYKSQRTISLNSHYIILFKNPRDAGQVSTLARQMYPGNSKFVIEAFKDATSTPHSYLLIDLRPEQDEKLRLRANIFPGQDQCVYVRK
jgi:hypothetical protein